MEKLNILPQYIYKFSLSEELVASSLAFVEGLDYALGGQQAIFDKKSTPELNSFIEECLDEVRVEEQMNFEHIKPHLIWANKRTTGKWHQRHLHPNSFLSGIIYLNTCDARTWFSLPNFWYPQSDREFVLSPYYSEKPNTEIIHQQESVAGTMVVFPSHLHHSVDNNKSDETRYTISFNAFPCGKFLVEDDHLMGIEIKID